MFSFMDYVVHSFGEATNWNRDNAYSSLTATSDAILDFPIPQHLRLNVSSLASPQFATSYSLGTFGLVDGSISYLYTTLPMRIPSQTLAIPLRTLIPGYRHLQSPISPSSAARTGDQSDRKDTLLNATLHLPTPSRLTGLYLRRTSPETLVTLYLNSTRATSASKNPPPAALLAHVSHDTGKYSIEGLASTDNALIGVRGLWNFASGSFSRPQKPESEEGITEDFVEGLSDIPPSTPAKRSKPSLLSAGGEFYYSPLSSVIGLSTGLRFTTLALDNAKRASKPLAGTSSALSSSHVTDSSFPYTLTLTLTPLTGSLASTYSVKASPNLTFSSRFGFNVYSWESEYILGAEIWRQKPRLKSSSGIDEEDSDGLAWARKKVAEWYQEGKEKLEQATNTTTNTNNDEMLSPNIRLLETSPLGPGNNPSSRTTAELDESVIKLRVDDRWNFRALWTGRIKELRVSAGLGIGPATPPGGLAATAPQMTLSSAGSGAESTSYWKGGFGVEVVYSS